MRTTNSEMNQEADVRKVIKGEKSLNWRIIAGEVQIFSCNRELRMVEPGNFFIFKG